MSSGDRTPRDVTFRDLAAPLAEESSTAAREMTQTQTLVREDPEFVDYRWWLAEERGEVRALGDALSTLQERFTDEDGVVDVLGFAEYCWHAHVTTNEQRSEATGASGRAAKGEHHGYHLALRVIREHTEIEYEDYGDTEEIAV